MNYSFIIPVYNRPEEIKELLESFLALKGNFSYEIVIVEDGSKNTSEQVIVPFQQKLNISYYYKKNTGPGDSRNYGMRLAKGDYFIILDSDCLLSEHYLTSVNSFLGANDTDCFGGPDAAHHSFSNLQKAINFVMTSFITTGGIRGKSEHKFQPRSFNMGLSKEAFEASKGFRKIHPGEDPDLVIRLHQLGYKTRLIKEATVYHKRRISWSKYYTQVYKFGIARAILNYWHPKTQRLIYWMPTLFLVGLILAILGVVVGIYALLTVYIIYFIIAFIFALFKTKNLKVALLSIIATGIQFLGYGYGFLKATVSIKVLRKSPQKTFPKLFF